MTDCVRTFRLCAGFLLLFGLQLTGCRSQQAAFRFHSPASAVAAVKAQPVAPVPAYILMEPIPVPAARSGARHFAGSRFQPPHSTALPATRPPQASRPNTVVPQLFKRHHNTARHAQAATKRDTLHLVIGALLIAGGIVAGLAVGGWLGLGLGAVVVVFGYYFLVLGIGGPDAWTEVFQEFFNM